MMIRRLVMIPQRSFHSPNHNHTLMKLGSLLAAMRPTPRMEVTKIMSLYGTLVRRAMPRKTRHHPTPVLQEFLMHDESCFRCLSNCNVGCHHMSCNKDDHCDAPKRKRVAERDCVLDRIHEGRVAIYMLGIKSLIYSCRFRLVCMCPYCKAKYEMLFVTPKIPTVDAHDSISGIQGLRKYDTL